MAKYAMLSENAGRDICLEPNPRLHAWQLKVHPMILDIYAHWRWWQGKTNQKDEMTYLIIDAIRQIGRQHPKDNYWEALANWLDVAAIEGYRGCEWVQEKDPAKHGFKEYEHDTLRTDNRIYAICDGDWDFVDEDGKFLNPFTCNRSKIVASDTTFWHQKNPEFSGIRILFAKMDKFQEHCCVWAKLRILDQFHRLGGKANTPLTVYKKNKNSKRPSHFLKYGVEKVMNDIGKQVYCTDKETMKRFNQRWTCNSMRMTALLYGKYQNGLIIKNRLQWASDKFEVYIRHTLVLAKIHANAASKNIEKYVNN